MDKITVAFECPNCHIVKKIKKAADMQVGKIKCPSCQTPIKLVFDISVEPQTATASIIANPQSQPSPSAAPTPPASNKSTTFDKPGISDPTANQPATQKKNKTIYADEATLGIGQTPPPIYTGKKATVVVDSVKQQKPHLKENVFLNRLAKKGKKIIEKYQIYEGSFTIGRQDPIIESDIMFDNDPEMSRQSVLLSVIPTYQSPVYRLKVLKATNPVVVGTHTLVHGEEVAVQPNEIFILGHTRLMLTNF